VGAKNLTLAFWQGLIFAQASKLLCLRPGLEGRSDVFV